MGTWTFKRSLIPYEAGWELVKFSLKNFSLLLERFCLLKRLKSQAAAKQRHIIFFAGRMAAKRQLPALNLLTGQKSTFSPRRVAPIQVKFGAAERT